MFPFFAFCTSCFPLRLSLLSLLLPTQDCLEQYVSQGGSFVVAGSSDAPNLLNSLFGWSVTASSSAGDCVASATTATLAAAADREGSVFAAPQLPTVLQVGFSETLPPLLSTSMTIVTIALVIALVID